MIKGNSGRIVLLTMALCLVCVGVFSQTAAANPPELVVAAKKKLEVAAQRVDAEKAKYERLADAVQSDYAEWLGKQDYTGEFPMQVAPYVSDLLCHYWNRSGDARRPVLKLKTDNEADYITSRVNTRGEDQFGYVVTTLRDMITAIESERSEVPEGERLLAKLNVQLVELQEAAKQYLDAEKELEQARRASEPTTAQTSQSPAPVNNRSPIVFGSIRVSPIHTAQVQPDGRIVYTHTLWLGDTALPEHSFGYLRQPRFYLDDERNFDYIP